MPVLKIGKYQPKYPLIQGGMGVDIFGFNLAGHVAKCGAVGIIASIGIAYKSPSREILQAYFPMLKTQGLLHDSYLYSVDANRFN